MPLNERPGGSIRPFCEPATVTSTPHSSCRYSIEASDETVSTMRSAGWPAASMARRMSGMRLVTPGEGSLWATQTALIVRPPSCAHPRPVLLRIGPTPPVARQQLRLEPQPLGHAVPERGELPGLGHQHAVAGRERGDQRRLPSPRARARIDHDRHPGPEDQLQALQHLAAEPGEL